MISKVELSCLEREIMTKRRDKAKIKELWILFNNDLENLLTRQNEIIAPITSAIYIKI